MFKDLKIKKKLMLSFLIIAALCAAMGIFASYNLKALNNSDTELYEHMTVPLSEISQISTKFEQTRIYLRNAITSNNPDEIQKNSDQISELRSDVSGLMDKLDQSIQSDDKDVQNTYAELTEARTAYGDGLDKVLAMAKENKDAEAQAFVNGDLGEAAVAEEKAITDLVNMTIDNAKEKSDANAADANRTIILMLVTAAIVVALSMIIGVYIAGLITKPLNKVVHMLEEMSKGHLSSRLKIDTKDEIGQMAATMDSFADGLQNNVIGVMNQISVGEMNAIITTADSQDEISPALKRTLDTVKDLSREIEQNVKAITEGKLDTRANAELYSGTWKDLVHGINSLIDSFVGPINITAEYVERISTGNIPPKITDTYQGDFNEIKNNINNCIDTMNGLIGETGRLATAVQEGKLDQKGDAAQFNGSWGDLISGVNTLIDSFVATDQYHGRIYGTGRKRRNTSGHHRYLLRRLQRDQEQYQFLHPRSRWFGRRKRCPWPNE